MAGWIHGDFRLFCAVTWCLASSILISQASAALVFDNAPFVVTLYELQSMEVTLAILNCSDTGVNNVTVVSLVGVHPTPPCGVSCFAVYPQSNCDPDTEYCLKFLPGTKLDQSVTPKYEVTVLCTNGTDNVSAIVDVRLTPNTPPRFDPNQFVAHITLPDTKRVSAGTIIYNVTAVDDQNDNVVYSMTSEPASAYFEIGAGDGIIRTRNALKSECINFITFKVNITDGHNDPVGPLSVHVTLDDSNASPHITNLNEKIQISEDLPTGSTIKHIIATDDEALSRLTYTMTAKPPGNLAFFEITGDYICGQGQNIKVKTKLDYEIVSFRNTNLSIIATDDDGCSSSLRYLDVTVIDANEPPHLQPASAAYTVYEGPDFGSPGLNIIWHVTDEDHIDRHTFSIIGGDDLHRFRINPNTGQLSINGDYDIDGNALPKTQTLVIQVKDKGNLTATANVTLNFLDRNDNRPVITPGNYDFSVCTTRKVGSTLATMVCTDRDSSFQGNNDVYFIGGGSGITVVPSGGIVLGLSPSPGQTFTTTAYCRDRGQYPGPLQSSAAMPISVTGTVCPTTTPAPPVTPTPQPTTKAVPTTVTSTPPVTVAVKNTRTWIDENLPWMIVAALLATGLLGLLSYVWIRYCSSFCRARCCQQRPTRPHRMTTPPKRITPVEESEVVGSDGSQYDFWKERYTDDDYGKQPNRNANPRPVTPVRGY